MTQSLRIIVAQLNFLVGDIQGNLDKILTATDQAREEFKADLIVFPELALTGYPPEDLLLRNDFHTQVKAALKTLTKAVHGIDVIVGYPERIQNSIFNAAAVFRDGKILMHYHKQCLPNYGVFDEKRYFRSGHKPCIFTIKDISIALVICEDLWFPEPAAQAVEAGAKCIISINASPFDGGKLEEREKILRARTQENQVPIIYVHSVGGQDEIIFDGRSMAMNADSELCHLAPVFETALIPVDLSLTDPIEITSREIHPTLSRAAKAYHALVLGVRDYMHKNGFSQALVGLSGGIDSALTLCIAADAVGRENVHAVLMPSRYTSSMSNEDAKTLAENLGVSYQTISIEPSFQAFTQSLKQAFADTPVNIAEENIQARCRAIILMGIANKFGKLVLTTGNKSEMAVGYATLYGDMAGGLAVLKDVYKTLVYELAQYRNKVKSVIPQRIIDRAPSAELAHGQTDQDSLPPYPILDAILQHYIEEDQSAAEIIAAGFEAETVEKVIKLVDHNEYKRRQAPLGIKITARAFGRDRRYPLTSGFGG